MLPFLSNWKLIATAAAVAIFGLLLWRFEANIKDAAYQQFYAKDVEQAMAEKQKEITQLEKLREIDKKTIVDLMNEQAKEHQSTAAQMSRLKNLKDGKLAPVLQDTLKSLGGTSK